MDGAGKTSQDRSAGQATLPADPDRLRTPKQLAEQIGISLTLIYALCATGQLRHFRVGAPGRRGKILIADADWEAYLAARRVGAGGPDPVPPAAPITPAPEFRHLRVRRPAG